MAGSSFTRLESTNWFTATLAAPGGGGGGGGGAAWREARKCRFPGVTRLAGLWMAAGGAAAFLPLAGRAWKHVTGCGKKAGGRRKIAEGGWERPQDDEEIRMGHADDDERDLSLGGTSCWVVMEFISVLSSTFVSAIRVDG